jgi:methylated-DNA-protein-cysteine methyltransferase related protein
MSPFKDRVIEIVRNIPYGKVVSYGQVALYAGLPRAAREVGWVLSELGEDLPWWRVINNKGVISIKGKEYDARSTQKKLLEAEGIAVSKDFQVDMEQYRFIPSDELLRKFQLSDAYIQTMIKRGS